MNEMDENENKIVITYAFDIDLNKITPEQVDAIRNILIQKAEQTVTYNTLYAIGHDINVAFSVIRCTATYCRSL